MNWRETMNSRWQAAPARQRRLMLVAGGLLLLALLWWLALAPALKVLNAAPMQHRELDAQLQQMQRLQMQAEALRSVPALDVAAARKVFDGTLKPLGDSAQLVQQLDRLTVTLKNVDPLVLAQWLAAARQNAHAVPVEAHLKRNAAGAWDGNVVFTLGAA